MREGERMRGVMIPGLYGGGGGGPNIHTQGNIKAHIRSIGLPGGPKQQQHGNPPIYACE